MQSKVKVHVTDNVYRHNPIPTTLGKTHLISQRLSLNMPRLNQNQRNQALTMRASAHNISKVSRVFGCHRNTKFGCTSISSKQLGWQIAVDSVDLELQILEWTGSLR